MKKGLITLLIIILLAGCGALGYYAYTIREENKEVKKINKETNEKVKELEKQLKNKEQKSTKNDSIFGYYKTGTIANSEKVDGDCIKGSREIYLSESGTFKSIYSTGCDGATQSGTYTQKGNNITLICDANSSQCPEGTKIEYILNNDETLTESPLNTDKTVTGIYKKVDTNQLELLNK